ncbi:DUF493 domain-containing protein [Thiorhodococcus mannitoliphagus]|uniref:UPF0250 protein G3480_09205 n=1 Tax=Thiorhodococcus mannitoliphagus TaxID=329406 RepID=A0A6P1DXP1_9GAMM|nr:DUF493 domain-containing protein [Thiorhodococcus mannitoliphagus]NEX20484.1 DUF493 domain-containing protein [Thiorhodococcus mannitoliphagus]
MSDEQETLFEFPCRYPIKAMGRADSGLETLVVEIVERHAPGIDETAVSVQPSSGGKWISVTVVIEAQSKPQLDAIYRDLSAHELIAWAL